jgi:GNAT superfamily N-acetyltransferase
MIVVKEISSKKELKAFIRFPFQLYKNHPCWVPPLFSEEMYVFNRAKNMAFRNAEAALFLAYQNGRIAGRVAAIINQVEVLQQGKKKVRFGWLDMVDDVLVTKALMERVMDYGKAHGLEYAEGPCGFSNMDRAGMLVDGFEEMSNMTTYYNAPYYREHLEHLGFIKSIDWVGYRIKVPAEIPTRVQAFATMVLEKYRLSVLHFTSAREIVNQADNLFQLMNRSFGNLPSFVPIPDYQVKQYKEKYLKFLHPDFLSFIADEDGKMVGFAITMPSFSKALQKARGRLFPFGFIHLLRAQRINDMANMYLIGVDPAYQNKGLTAVIFEKIIQGLLKRGIRYVETNPEMEDNIVVQSLWKNYQPTLIKRWRLYKKEIL